MGQNNVKPVSENPAEKKPHNSPAEESVDGNDIPNMRDLNFEQIAKTGKDSNAAANNPPILSQYEINAQAAFEAVEKDDLGKLKELVTKIDINKVKNASKKTLLFFAIDEGKESIVKFLLDKGADVHSKNYGRTPLHAAAAAGDGWKMGMRE